MPKTKVSVTVEGSLLEQVDRMARGASRSEVVEKALATWLLNRRRERLEEEIELYYRSLGTVEREEDASCGGALRPVARRELEMNSEPLRGCLYWVRIPGEPDAKLRPALVVSVDARNRLANDVLVVPASTTLRPAPTHVGLKEGVGGVPRNSILKCEQITTLPKYLLSEVALGGPLSAALLEEVERGVLRAIGVAV